MQEGNVLLEVVYEITFNNKRNEFPSTQLVSVVTVHLLSRLAVTGSGYSSETWIHPWDYAGGLKPHEW
jgi:hypothetical protein